MLNILNILLAEATEPAPVWPQYVILGVLIVAMVIGFWFTSRSNKKKQAEQQNLLNSVAPGNKVKTIGGICGVVVEVNAEDNTFVLETGSETTGKMYIKFDKQAIYQTDAKAPVAEKKEVKEVKTEEPAIEQKSEDDTEKKD